MSNDKNNKDLQPRLCDWCDSSTQSHSRQRKSVCQRCYLLLTCAGIPDKEIFGKKDSFVKDELLNTFNPLSI
jgi:sulfatase maturation enzyme AslB (radical SAM superfamily)